MKINSRIVAALLFCLAVGVFALRAQEASVTYEIHYDRQLSPGDTLVLRVALHIPQGYHVYAPNSDNRNMGYVVTETQFPPRLPGGILKIGANKMYDTGGIEIFGEGMGQTVNLVQRFKIPKPPRHEGEEITFSGTLRYQLCEQMTCFSPIEIPITCTVSVKK